MCSSDLVESVRQVDATQTPRPTLGGAAGLPSTPLIVGPGSASSPVVMATVSPLPGIQSPVPAVAPTPTRGVQVEVRAVDRSWLAVWVDAQPVLEEEVRPGFSRTFSGDRSVRMRVGNAAAIGVTVNGITQGPLGARGQVIDAFWGRQ